MSRCKALMSASACPPKLGAVCVCVSAAIAHLSEQCFISSRNLALLKK